MTDETTSPGIALTLPDEDAPIEDWDLAETRSAYHYVNEARNALVAHELWGDPIPGGSAEGLALRASSMALYSGTFPTVIPQLWPNFDRSRDMPSVADAVARNPLFLGPAWRIAFRLGALPLKTFSIIDPESGNRKENGQHPAAKLLRRPVPIEIPLTTNLLVSGTVLGMFAHRRIGWVKNRGENGPDGPPVELWPVPGAYLFPVRDRNTLLSSYEIRVPGLPVVPLRLKDVCYFRLTPDLTEWADGFSPFQALGSAGEYGRSAIDAGTDLFDNGAFAPWWLEVPNRLNPKREQRLRAQMEGARSKRGSTPVLEGGAKLHELGTHPTDDLLRGAIEVARDLINSVVGYFEDGDQKRFYGEAIQPIADVIEKELERSLYSEWDNDPAFPEFTFREILKGTPAERIGMHKDAIYSMQETPNEARRAENLPPIEGGDNAFGPLNLIAIGMLVEGAERPAKDTQGGTGGDQGKDSTVSAVTPKASQAARMRAAVKRNWGTLRQRTLAGQSRGLSKRLRGVMKAELGAIKDAMIPPAVRGIRSVIVAFPSVEELMALVADNDEEIETLLRAFMDQTSQDARVAAAELVNADAAEVIERLEQVLASRAAAVSARFTETRAGDLQRILADALAEGTPIRDLAEAIGERWAGLADWAADGIARTETAFAYEQAALATWAQAGVESFEFVFGGGPCTTGVCEDAADAAEYRIGDEVGDVGWSFEGADSPPLHPGCTCYSVPAIQDAALAEAATAAADAAVAALE